MKGRKGIMMRLGAVLLMAFMLAGCVSSDPEQKKEETDVRQEGTNTYIWGDLSTVIPEEYVDLLTVKQGDGKEGTPLLTIWERASLERAKADGVEKPEDEWGWICTLSACNREEYEQMLVGDPTGVEFIAKDADTWYFLSKPTDVRLYSSSGEYTEDILSNWDQANQVAAVLREDFVSRNELEPWTMEDIYGADRYAYDSDHLFYRWTPKKNPDDELRLILSQPASKGDGGIWCVEQFSYTKGYGGSYYFPNTPGMDSLTYYADVQKEHDAGTREDYATPEACIRIFLEENPFMGPTKLEDGVLTQVEAEK